MTTKHCGCDHKQTAGITMLAETRPTGSSSICNPESCQRLAPVAQAMNALSTLNETRPYQAGELCTQPLSDLATFFVDGFHARIKEYLYQVSLLLPRICAQHAWSHPELFKLQTLLRVLDQELTIHMLKEEKVVFPEIARREREGVPFPAPAFDRVSKHVRALVNEHEKILELLAAIREASHNYTCPVDACRSYQQFYASLREFDRDFRRYSVLESCALYERAVRLSAGL